MKELDILAMAVKGGEIYHRFCQPVCKRFGLGTTAFDVLLFLANNPEYNTARDMCRVRGIKSGIVSVTVEQLIQSGYLIRQSDEKDRRIQRLHPTAQAEPLVQAGRQAQRAFEEAIGAGLTSEELETYFRLTRKMVSHIDRLERDTRR